MLSVYSLLCSTLFDLFLLLKFLKELLQTYLQIRNLTPAQLAAYLSDCSLSHRGSPGSHPLKVENEGNLLGLTQRL